MDMLSSLLSKPPSVKIVFEGDREKSILRNNKGDLVEYDTYNDTDTVRGKVVVELNKNKHFEHNGIKIELIGVIENFKDKRQTTRFIALERDLEPLGHLNNEITQYDFEFSGVEKQYETYKGNHIAVRYYLQTTLASKYKNFVTEAEFVVFKPKSLADLEKENKPMKIEVGIEEWLHVSWECDHSKFFLRDQITGQVIFRKVSVRLTSMEIQIVKRETLGAGVNASHENEVIAKFEIMDGAPFKNEEIPIRLYLQGYNNLTPTFTNVNNKFSVQYFLNLVLIDSEERRFFKQMEINLFRWDKKKLETKKENTGVNITLESKDIPNTTTTTESQDQIENNN